MYENEFDPSKMAARWLRKLKTQRGQKIDESNPYMSQDMRFPTMWYVRSARAQTSLCICAV